MSKTTLIAVLAFVPSIAFAQTQAGATASARVQTSAGSVGADARAAARLEGAKAALVRGGHARPEDQEVRLAARAMERGASEAQIESLARHAPANRSLAVSFNVLTTLALRGVPVNEAVARLSAKLDANASDSQIASLVSSAGARIAPPDEDAAAGVNATLGGLGGAAAGVTGVLRKP